MNNVVNWFEIYTSDFNRAKKFYSELFKCTLTDLPVGSENHPEMKYATFPGDQNKYGINGALVYLDAAKPGMGGTLVYFFAEGIIDDLSRVEAAGGKIIRGKQSIGEYGFVALIEDTEGNMIGLQSMK
ncbi:MAG: VOC family protein [Ginsengibacter sp.]